MIQINNNQGYIGNIYAKGLEICLIVSFLISIILLIINFSITTWLFKYSYPLLIIEIFILILSALCLFFSIILTIWRTNGSVIDKNFSSSLCISRFNIVFVIINMILSIVEDVLFYFIYAFFGFMLSILEGDIENFDSDSYKNIAETFDKIMNNVDDGVKLFDDDDDRNDIINKIKTLRTLPWISFNINIIIQFMTLIFFCNLIRKIRLKSNFGLPQMMDSQSVQNRMIGNQNVVVLPYNQFNINQMNPINQMNLMNKNNQNNIKQKGTDIISSNSELDATKLKVDKKKKKEKKHKK